MISLFRNFWNTLKRYKVASVLNILGLSVAFAAFGVIMMQVRYDLTYDKFHTYYDRIYRVESKWLNDDGSEIEMFKDYHGGVSLPMTRLLESFHPDIVGTARFSNTQSRTVSIKSDPSEAEYPFREEMTAMTPASMRVFDFPLLAGDSTRFSDPNTAIIPESFAEKMFGQADPVGQFLYLSTPDSEPREVVGVYRDFPVNSLLKNDIYIRTEYNPNDEYPGNINGKSFIRLSSPSKKDEVEKAVQVHLKQLFGADYNYLYRLSSLRDIHYLQDVDGDPAEKINASRTYLLLGIAVLIILIAAINFINFSTSLVPSRLKSVNTQRVLGQTTTGIRTSMIFEAVGTCLISVAISYALLHFISTTSLAALLPADMSLSVNVTVLLSMLLIAAATGMLAGLYPAYLIASFSPALVLKGSFGLSPRGRRLRTALTGLQYFISFALIIVALFMHAQYDFMSNHSLGYDKDNVLTFRLNSKLDTKTDVVRENLVRHPDIREVGFSNGLIFGTNMNARGGREYRGRKEVSYHEISISPELIDVLGIRVLEGRNLNQSDTQKQNGAFLVNETARDRYGLDVGFSIDDVWDGDEEEPPSRIEHEIVGIVSDFNYKPLHGSIDPLVLSIPNQKNYRFGRAYVKANGGAIPAVISHIRQSVAELDPEYSNFSIQFIDETIGRYYEKEKKIGDLITIFSLLAVCISLIGVFGLVLFEIQYRRKEIGIRKIHGATVGEILWQLNTGFGRIVIICFLVAVPVAYFSIVKWLEQFAYKAPLHWWLFAATFFVVLALTLLTVTLQSYRAATENPVNSIKTE